MAEYKPFLDVIFGSAERLMWDLSAESGEFTNYEFLRRACQKQQGAYANFLKTVLDTRGEAFLFNIVHENIGNRLSSEAVKLGYEQDKNPPPSVQETNIWGDPSKPIVYRRTDRVRNPVG